MKKYTLFLIFALSACLGITQNVVPPVFSGQIIDQDGEPILGATVRVKNTNTGCISDIQGRFRLFAAADDVLQFSYAGAAPCEFSRDEIEMELHHTITMEYNQLPECVIRSCWAFDIESVITCCGVYRQNCFFNNTTGNVGNDSTNVETYEISGRLEYAPNPTRDAVTVKTEKGQGRILVFSGSGAEVVHEMVTDISTRVDLSRYPSGVYFLYFEDKTSVELIGKIVLAKD